MYILQEKYGKLWFDLHLDDDLDFLNRMKEAFRKKYENKIYRVIEVK